jgi:hypothetical protein
MAVKDNALPHKNKATSKSMQINGDKTHAASEIKACMDYSYWSYFDAALHTCP